MIYFPFIFFGILFIKNYIKRGLDVYSFLILLYVVSSLFSIFVDSLNLYRYFDIFKYPLGLFAPFVYCFLLAICFYPFKKFNSNKIKEFKSINEKWYNLIVWIFFGIFILMLAVSYNRLSEIITTQTLSAIRDDFYHGNAESIWSNYTGWFRYFIAIMSLLAKSSFILILFFFFNVAILHKSLGFNIITLLGSSIPLIQSLYIADRSSFIQWLLIFCLSFVIFRRHMSIKVYRQFVLYGCIIFTLLIIYLAAVSISRFGEEAGSSVYDALVYYAGSSYIQFCNFFNVLDSDAPFSLSPLFPFTYWILGMPGYFEQCEVVESYYRHGVSNFSTFLGMILSMSGKLVMFFFVFVYYNISNILLKRKNLNSISFRQLTLFFIVVLIPTNGLFGYYYMSYSSVFDIIIWLMISYFVTKK